jgi:LPXTG-motif cell wall-anchored protein
VQFGHKALNSSGPYGLTATERMLLMSFARRLAAGLPVAGVTALAALAFTGAPAAATGDETARVAHPAVMTTPSADDQRGDADGYGGEAPNDNATETPTRGRPGYGSESPTTTPPTTPPTTVSPSPSTPTASVDTVPPGGELPATSPAATPSPSESTPGGGVSAGGTLPLTGAPLGLTAAVGGALLVAGAGAVLYGRRRKA